MSDYYKINTLGLPSFKLDQVIHFYKQQLMFETISDFIKFYSQRNFYLTDQNQIRYLSSCSNQNLHFQALINLIVILSCSMDVLLNNNMKIIWRKV